MNAWAEYEFFVRVVELGSLSKAAEALGLSSPSASRRLTALEERLGVRLIERSTRRLYVTEVGQDFYARCKAALTSMQEAVEAVGAAKINPLGQLRITASVSLSLELITPLLSSFCEKYPQVSVEVITANRYYDIIDNDIDLAIRTREYESDSSLVVRELAKIRRILAASPSYLSRHGFPAHVKDLHKHKLLLYTYALRPDELHFQRGEESVKLPVSGSLQANDGQVLRLAALQGMGILVQPMYVIYRDLMAGRLVPLLTDWKLPLLSINMVYPHRRHLPAKTRAFIDHMVEDFKRQDQERRWDSFNESPPVAMP